MSQNERAIFFKEIEELRREIASLKKRLDEVEKDRREPVRAS